MDELTINEGDAMFNIESAPVQADPPCPGLSPGLLGYNHFYIFSGAPGSGKSTMLYNLLHKRKAYRNKFDKVILFCPSGTLDFEIPASDVHNGFDIDELYDILHDKNLVGDDVLIILDDCVQDLTSNSKQLLKMLYNRRHVFAAKRPDEEDSGDEDEEELEFLMTVVGPNPEEIGEAITIMEEESEREYEEWEPHGSLSVWITTQKYNKIPLAYRSVANGIFMWKPDPREATNLYQDVISNFIPDPSIWRAAINRIYKKPHDCLYVNILDNTMFRNMRPLTITY